MPEIFIRCCPESQMRLGLAQAVVARCAMWDARIVLLVGRGSYFIPDPGGALLERHVIAMREFARESRIVADSIAAGPYCLIDDDQLPIGKSWLEDGFDALRYNPGYAMLSSWSINGEVPAPVKIASAAGPAMADGPIFEVHSCGTPCFVNKGMFAHAPTADAPEYDNVLSAWLRTRGRIGFLRHVRHNHLGYGYSQVVPGHWGA